ncbi:MAG: hypothetical protein M3O70_10700 [Actinomycetota bacterium]|nr:hypothetical protein [Actinomycetota bacterium]
MPDIAEVRATGERTVEFRLANPLADFFGFGGVGSVPIVPKHIWSTIPNAAVETDPAVLVDSAPTNWSPTPAARVPTSTVTVPTTTTSSAHPSSAV